MDLVAQALATFWLVLLLRSLDRVARWVVQDRKPWSCDPCLAFWCSMLVGLLAHADWRWLLLRGVGAAGAAVLALEVQRRLVGPPAPPPALPPGP